MTTHSDAPAVIQRVTARSAEIGGGIAVNRLIPTRDRRMIGAWCFLDHAGPAGFTAGGGMEVGAHPHIGLQTFTWMIEGEVLHRDSLGHEQVIRPGQVNLMTAGRGIAHTEASLAGETRLHAAQLWIALPDAVRNCEPAFDHHPELPSWDAAGCRFTLLAGSHDGRVAPTRLHSPLLGLDLHMPRGGAVDLPLDPGFEYGVSVLDGALTIGGERFAINELAVLGSRRAHATLHFAPGTRALLLGGAPFGEDILMWWNFVGRSKDEISRATRDWESGAPRFGPVAGPDERRLAAPPLPWLRA